MSETFESCICRLLEGFLNQPNGTPAGKKIVFEHQLVDPHIYLNELFNPSNKYGLNNPEFDDMIIETRGGSDVTFISTPTQLFCIRVDPDSELKFSVVKDPSPDDDIVELMTKSDMTRTGSTPFTTLSVLFDNLMGIIIKLLNTSRTYLIFTGADQDLTNLYTKAIKSQHFKSIAKLHKLKVIQKSKYFIFKREPQ